VEQEPEDLMRLASTRQNASLLQLARATTAAILSVLLAGQPLLAEGKSRPVKPVEIQGQQRILHALNRLTFGPRPGDLARVQAIGLDQWFERQLHPSSIDDSALDVRLAQFPAMQMSTEELARRYPGPQIIKAMAQRDTPLPADPTLHTIYADQIAFYNMQQERKADKSTDTIQPNPTMQTEVADNVKKGKKALSQSMQDDGVGDPADGTRMDGASMNPAKPVPPSETAPFATAPVHRNELFPQEKALEIIAQIPGQRMQTIMALPPDQLVRFRQSLTARELAGLIEGMTPLQKETLMALGGSLRVIGGEELQSRLLRDIYSERQLEAVMTDFWLNHFNVYIKKSQREPYQIPAFERETIRPHALGKFEDLLVATAESPAMLTYLDNWRSIGPDSRAAQRIKQVAQARPDGKIAKAASEGLNENYGRELMELHTVGVNGGYTQDDVTQVAKVFTGWTIGKPGENTANPYQVGGFVFDARRHEPGPKVVMGETIPEGGQKEGLAVLHMLASSPATARFLSTKLAIRFVSDDPPQSLIDKMSSAYLFSGGDIKAVLRAMFHAPEFWAPAAYRAKVKTPLEFVVSAARAGNLDVNNAQALVASLDKLGMPLYGMQTPNGYSWKNDEWVNTGALVSRMNFALAMTGDKLPDVRTGWTALLGPAPAQSAAQPVAMSTTPATDPLVAKKERSLEIILLGEPVSDRTRATVLSQSNDADAIEQASSAFDLGGAGKGRYGGGRLARLGPGVANDDPQAAVMAGLILGSPEFQRR